jgi:flagellar biosynthesis GTPase FlhF
MQIHRVRGRDLRDALERASRAWGHGALVLSHEVMPDGGVTVAVTKAERPKTVRGGTPEPPKARDASLLDVARVLRRSGCSDDLVEATLVQVESAGATGPFALDAAAAALGQGIRVAPSPKLARGAGAPLAPPCVLAFVGPTGAGKTTTLAKLASRLVRAGRRISVISMDTRRPGAVEPLRALAAAWRTEIELASDGAELARIVARSRGADCVLVDTTGRSPRDSGALTELASTLALPSLESYLVLEATASPAAVDEARQGFAAIRPSAWVITKLDETRAPAPVLEAARRTGAPVAFLCDGQDVGGHMHRAHAERFADLFLRGRIA